MKYFKVVPDELQHYKSLDKITIKEWMVAVWIYTHYNPINGKYITSYKDMVDIFDGIISYDTMRHIFPNLRSLRIIHFINRRGSRGKFEVSPNKIKLKGNNIQVINEFGGIDYATDDDNDPALYPPPIPIRSQLSEENHNSDISDPPEKLLEEPINKDANHNPLDTDEDVNINLNIKTL